MTIRTWPRRVTATAGVRLATDHALGHTSTPYQVAGFNFPINFLPAGPIHGSVIGRRALANVPGSFNTLKTVERTCRRPGPNDGQVLRFRFELAEKPEDINEGFGFLIDDFWLPTSGRPLLLSAWISVTLGGGRLQPIDVTTSSRLLATDPFSLMFATPPGVTWSSFYAMADGHRPSHGLALDYFLELTRPSVRLASLRRLARRHRRVVPPCHWLSNRVKRVTVARHG